MKGIKSFVSRKCCSINPFVKNLLLATTEVAPPTDVCYVFEFDMVDPSDEITLFGYENGGSQTVEINSALSQSKTQIQIDIAIAFNAAGITAEFGEVTKTDIGGGLFHINITLTNPNVVFTLIDISGNVYTPTITDCT